MEETSGSHGFSVNQHLQQAQKAVADGSMTVKQASVFYMVDEETIQEKGEENDKCQTPRLFRKYRIEFKDDGEWELRHGDMVVKNAKKRAQVIDMFAAESVSRNITKTKVAKALGLQLGCVVSDYRDFVKRGRAKWYSFLKAHPLGYENLVPKLSFPLDEPKAKKKATKEKPTSSSVDAEPREKTNPVSLTDIYTLHFKGGEPGGDFVLEGNKMKVTMPRQRALALDYILTHGITRKKEMERISLAFGLRPKSVSVDLCKYRRGDLHYFEFLKNHPLGFRKLVGSDETAKAIISEYEERNARKGKETVKGKKKAGRKKKGEKSGNNKKLEMDILVEDDKSGVEESDVVCLEKIKEEIIDLVEDEVKAKEKPSTSAAIAMGNQIQIRIEKLKLSLVTADGKQQFATPTVSDTVVSQVKKPPEPTVTFDDDYELLNAEYYVKVKLCLDAIIREGRAVTYPSTCINLTQGQVNNIMELYRAGHFPWYLFSPEKCQDLAAERILAKNERVSTLKEMRQGLDAYVRKIAPCVPRSFDVNKLWKIEMKGRETPKPLPVMQRGGEVRHSASPEVKKSRTGRKVAQSRVMRTDFVSDTRKPYKPRKSVEPVQSAGSEELPKVHKTVKNKPKPVKEVQKSKNPSTDAPGKMPKKRGRPPKKRKLEARNGTELPRKGTRIKKLVDNALNPFVNLGDPTAVFAQRKEKEAASLNDDIECLKESEASRVEDEAVEVTDSEIIDETSEVTNKAGEFLNIVALSLNNHHVTVSVNELKCIKCSVSFSYLFQLGDHLWTKHSIGQYQCPMCPSKSELTVFMYGHMVHAHDVIMCQICHCEEKFIRSEFEKHILESHPYYHDFFDIFCPSKASILNEMINSDGKLKRSASIQLDRVEDTPLGKIFLGVSPCELVERGQKRKRFSSERGGHRKRYRGGKSRRPKRPRRKSMSDVPQRSATVETPLLGEASNCPDEGKQTPELYTCPHCDVSLFCTLSFFNVHVQGHGN